MPMSTARLQQRRWLEFATRNAVSVPVRLPKALPNSAKVVATMAGPVEPEHPLTTSEDPWERDLGEKYLAEFSAEAAKLGERHGKELAALEAQIGHDYQMRLQSHYEEVATKALAHDRLEAAKVAEAAHEATAPGRGAS